MIFERSMLYSLYTPYSIYFRMVIHIYKYIYTHTCMLVCYCHYHCDCYCYYCGYFLPSLLLFVMPYQPGLFLDLRLVSVVMSSWGNDMSVDMVIASIYQ